MPSGNNNDPTKRAEESIHRGLNKNKALQNNIFNSVHLGIIEELEKDSNGDYRGTASVRLVTTPTKRVRCLIPVFAGTACWFGGLPPAGSLCQISWLPLGVAVITAIYPLSFRRLINDEGLVDIIPGELLLQSSSGQLKDNQIPGGRVLMDRHGRITLEDRSKEVRITLGDPELENGLVDAESIDEETGSATRLRIEFGDAVINFVEGGGITIQNDTGTVVLDDGEIRVHSQTIKITSENMEILSDNGKKLATEDFVNNVYNRHTHTAGAMVAGPVPVTGISATPTLKGTASHLTQSTEVE